MVYTLSSETYNYEINLLQSNPLYGHHVQDAQLKDLPNKYPAFASLLVIPESLETHQFLDSLCYSEDDIKLEAFGESRKTLFYPHLACDNDQNLKVERLVIMDITYLNYHTKRLYDWFDDFYFGCATGVYKAQLLVVTGRAELMNHKIFNPETIWLADTDKNDCIDIYSLDEFKGIETFNGNLMNAYLGGRFGGL